MEAERRDGEEEEEEGRGGRGGPPRLASAFDGDPTERKSPN